MTPSQALSELGLTLPAVAQPLGAYVPAVLDGDRVWTSGALPVLDGNLPATGLVGAEPGADVDPDAAKTYAATCALNALAAAAEAAGGLDNLAGVVKVVGFVASAPGFVGQPGVVNGASELLGKVFGDKHARSAVGVAALPNGAPVEVEAVFRVR